MGRPWHRSRETTGCWRLRCCPLRPCHGHEVSDGDLVATQGAAGIPVARLQRRQRSRARPISREEVSDEDNLQVRLGSHLLGSTVKNPQGKELGSIKDLVISPEDNRVIYAVLSFGGVLGLGEKAVAMPLSVLKSAAEAKTFEVEMDPERLRPASEFNQDNSPQMTDL